MRSPWELFSGLVQRDTFPRNERVPARWSDRGVQAPSIPTATSKEDWFHAAEPVLFCQKYFRRSQWQQQAACPIRFLLRWRITLLVFKSQAKTVLHPLVAAFGLSRLGHSYLLLGCPAFEQAACTPSVSENQAGTPSCRSRIKGCSACSSETSSGYPKDFSVLRLNRWMWSLSR